MKKFKFLNKNGIAKLPKTTGIYCFEDSKSKILYIGKAINIKERVKNHFQSRSEGKRRTNVLGIQQSAYKDNLFINRVEKVGYLKTNSEIEALILEAKLIKQYQPKHNVLWRDDKNYFYVAITKEDLPRALITHQLPNNGNDGNRISVIGPFVDGKTLRQALKILRKIFPYRTCRTLPKHPCLWHQLNRCPAPCLLSSALSAPASTKKQPYRFRKSVDINRKLADLKRDCRINIKNLINVLRGKKMQVLKDLKKEMKTASGVQNYEKANTIKSQIEALEKVLANAKILRPSEKIQSWNDPNTWKKTEKKLKKILKSNKKISKIEAYDVSNIQGQEATGSMVTFINGKPEKSWYRKFKIQGKFAPYRLFEEETEAGPNDIAMIKEILQRRLKHKEWPWPDLMLIDGGKAQLNAALNVLNQHKSAESAPISVSALAKKENKLYLKGRKKPILLKILPREIFNLILQLRDEAHRFAISYHHRLRKKALLKK